MAIIIFIISFIISIKIVNGAYDAYMKMMGADFMMYDGKKKIGAIIVCTFVVAGIIGSVLGIGG